MQIEIIPEDIDKYVKDAILKSTFGGTIVENINLSLKKIVSDWDSPIKKFIHNEMVKHVQEFLKKEESKALLAKAITKYLSEDVILKIIDYGLLKIKKEIRELEGEYE